MRSVVRCGLALLTRSLVLTALAASALAVQAQTFTLLAVENQTFTVSGSRLVRYGVDPRWITRTVSGTVPCTNAFFGGDPAVGVGKACWLSSELPSAWSFLAFENQIFTVQGTRTVRFGAEPNWIERVVTGSVPCTNAFFGRDPAVGVGKQCQLSSVVPAIVWDFIASENQSFTVLGTQTVRYGAEPRWIIRTVSGTVACTNAFFGSDPAVGVGKQCQVARSGAPGFDTTPPTVALTAPTNLTTNLTGTITLRADATDNVGVQSVEFQVDGATVGTPDTGAPYTATFDTNTLASGQHVVRARARDGAGNVSAWATSVVTFGGLRNMPQGFVRLDSWVTGLANASAMAMAPDGRVFVIEQGGRVRVVRNGVLQATPFTTLPLVDATGERGGVGIALDPAFATNGRVYVYYTTRANGTHNRISRFTAVGDVASGGETVLVDLPPLSAATNHNGGALLFGSDGKLYVGVGENGLGSRAQDTNDPLGKVLRFNADGTIPADNPFAASRTGLARAIWAYGLRNPFTMAIQPGTDRIFINDVGEVTWEEINVAARGANYGWPLSEGPDRIASGMTAPLFTYRHGATSPAGSGPGNFIVGNAIAGGAFYPASGPFPASYRGSYFFADFIAGFVARVDLANGNAVSTFGTGFTLPVSLKVGADGALYVLTRTSIVRITGP